MIKSSETVTKSGPQNRTVEKKKKKLNGGELGCSSFPWSAVSSPVESHDLFTWLHTHGNKSSPPFHFGGALVRQTGNAKYIKKKTTPLHTSSPNTSAAAAAKSLQSCPTVWPHRRQATRLPRPWDSSSKNTGVGCHFLLPKYLSL